MSTSYGKNKCVLKGQKTSQVFSLGKLQEKLKAHFSTINILANDQRLLEKDTAFNVE